MPVTVFLNAEKIAQGSERQVIEALRSVTPPERSSDLLAFDDETGMQVDFDLRPEAEEAPARGRPALGVVAREITLLPRHWEWLARQRGGASATLRKLVEDARRKGRTEKECHDAAYWFLSVIAGDFPMFEDAVREIYLGNRVGYDHFTHGWPEAIRDHGRALAFPE